MAQCNQRTPLPFKGLITEVAATGADKIIIISLPGGIIRPMIGRTRGLYRAASRWPVI